MKCNICDKKHNAKVSKTYFNKSMIFGDFWYLIITKILSFSETLAFEYPVDKKYFLQILFVSNFIGFWETLKLSIS